MANAITIEDLVDDLEGFDYDCEVYMDYRDRSYGVSDIYRKRGTLYLIYSDDGDDVYTVGNLIDDLSNYNQNLEVVARFDYEDGDSDYYDVDPSGGYLDDDGDYCIMVV